MAASSSSCTQIRSHDFCRTLLEIRHCGLRISLLRFHEEAIQRRRSVPHKRLSVIRIFDEHLLSSIQHPFQRVCVACHRGKQIVAHLVRVQANLGEQCRGREDDQQKSKRFHNFTSVTKLAKEEPAVASSPTKWEGFPDELGDSGKKH